MINKAMSERYRGLQYWKDRAAELEDDLRVANELLDHYRAKALLIEQMAKLPSGGRAESVLLSVSQWDNAGEEL